MNNKVKISPKINLGCVLEINKQLEPEFLESAHQERIIKAGLDIVKEK